jgi:hypothetical protein
MLQCCQARQCRQCQRWHLTEHTIMRSTQVPHLNWVTQSSG